MTKKVLVRKNLMCYGCEKLMKGDVLYSKKNGKENEIVKIPGVRFCPRCGRKLKERKTVEDE